MNLILKIKTSSRHCLREWTWEYELMGGQEGGFDKSVVSISTHKIRVMINTGRTQWFCAVEFPGLAQRVTNWWKKGTEDWKRDFLSYWPKHLLFYTFFFFFWKLLSNDLLSHKNFPWLEIYFSFNSLPSKTIFTNHNRDPSQKDTYIKHLIHHED